MAEVKKGKHFGKITIQIPAGYVREKIEEALVTIFPRHFEKVPAKDGEKKPYWKLIKMATKTKSGHLSELICTLQRDSDVPKEEFYPKDEIEVTVPVEHLNLIQTTVEDHIKETHIGDKETEGKFEATWEADSYNVDDSAASDEKYILKVEFKALLRAA